LAKPTLYQNWLTKEDIASLLDLTSYEVVKQWEEILWPLRTPLIEKIANRFLVRLWPLSYGALVNIVVARLEPNPKYQKVKPSVSVVIPARNESGNIPAIFDRVPAMGSRDRTDFC
jgi:hypothetical protein